MRDYAAAGLLLISFPAHASDRAEYSYDALGRVIRVERRATGGSGVLNDYFLDAASNRQRIESSGQFKGPALLSGGQLNKGETLLSADARFRLVLQFDGNLVLYNQSNVAL